MPGIGLGSLPIGMQGPTSKTWLLANSLNGVGTPPAASLLLGDVACLTLAAALTANSVTVARMMLPADITANYSSAGIAPPAAGPVGTDEGSGGSLPTKTKYVAVATYVNAAGQETLASATSNVTTASATDSISWASPAVVAGAVSWRLYVAIGGTASPLYLYVDAAASVSGTAPIGVPILQQIETVATSPQPPGVNGTAIPCGVFGACWQDASTLSTGAPMGTPVPGNSGGGGGINILGSGSDYPPDAATGRMISNFHPFTPGQVFRGALDVNATDFTSALTVGQQFVGQPAGFTAVAAAGVTQYRIRAANGSPGVAAGQGAPAAQQILTITGIDTIQTGINTPTYNTPITPAGAVGAGVLGPTVLFTVLPAFCQFRQGGGLGLPYTAQ